MNSVNAHLRAEFVTYHLSTLQCARTIARFSNRLRLLRFTQIFLLGAWPMALTLLAMAMVYSVASLAFLPVAIFYHTRTRPPLNQEDAQIERLEFGRP